MSTPFTPQFHKGDTVVFTGQTVEQRRWGGNSDANEVLTKGSTYTVEKVEVHSWHTKLHLVGVTGRFNSACFGLSDIVTSL
jgi:hypothetical protein